MLRVGRDLLTTQLYRAGHPQNPSDFLFRRLAPDEQRRVSMAIRPHAAVTLEDAEDDGLAVGATPAPALDPACPEEALVDLDDPEQRTLGLAGNQDVFPQAAVEPVHGVAVQTAQRRRLEGCQIGGEVTNQLADLALGDP